MQRKIRSVLVVLGVYAVVGAVYEPLDSGALTLAGPLTGLSVGVPLVLFEAAFPLRFLRGWPFAAAVLVRAALYLGLFLLVFLGGTLAYGLAHGLTLADFREAAWSASTATKVAAAFGALVVVVFFRQLDRLLGPGTLVRYLFGRYHRPRREERVFMFLDLRGSTAIAERLGVDAYYALLNDFFHDLAEPALATGAQIYQYVGDEVVLTWPMARGLRDGDCVRAFYAIDAAVRRRGPTYLARYGLVPEFKAALHGGEVVRAEIGDLKRDLVYSGDVLNTAARIEAACNGFGARLLASAALCERLALPPGVEAEPLGEVALRGKRDAVGLVRLRGPGDGPVGGPGEVPERDPGRRAAREGVAA